MMPALMPVTIHHTTRNPMPAVSAGLCQITRWGTRIGYGAGAALNADRHHRLAAHYPGTAKERHQEMPP
jgi:hypothetical protein